MYSFGWLFNLKGLVISMADEKTINKKMEEALEHFRTIAALEKQIKNIDEQNEKAKEAIKNRKKVQKEKAAAKEKLKNDIEYIRKYADLVPETDKEKQKAAVDGFFAVFNKVCNAEKDKDFADDCKKISNTKWLAETLLNSLKPDKSGQVWCVTSADIRNAVAAKIKADEEKIAESKKIIDDAWKKLSAEKTEAAPSSDAEAAPAKTE